MKKDDYEVVAKPPLVIDNGTGFIKAGFAAEERPALIFNSYVGRPKHKKIFTMQATQELYVGKRATDNKGLLKLTYPMEHGIIKNKKDMEQLWHYVYDELKLSSQDQPVLLTEAPLNPLENKRESAKIFLESFSAPGICICSQAVLSLYSLGKTTGAMLDCGDGVCHAVPVYDGFSITNCIDRIDFAGRDVTEYLQSLLRKSGYCFNTSSEFEVVRAIKERACSLITAAKGDEKTAEKEQREPMPYILPDGTSIMLGDEKYKAPDILFYPEKAGFEYKGVHEMLYKSIIKTDIDLRKELFTQIYLSGGTTMFAGFAMRLLNELKALKAEHIQVKIFSPSERQYSCWLGGSILASLNSFTKMLISKKEFDEVGANILNTKTF